MGWYIRIWSWSSHLLFSSYNSVQLIGSALLILQTKIDFSDPFIKNEGVVPMGSNTKALIVKSRKLKVPLCNSIRSSESIILLINFFDFNELCRIILHQMKTIWGQWIWKIIGPLIQFQAQRLPYDQGPSSTVRPLCLSFRSLLLLLLDQSVVVNVLATPYSTNDDHVITRIFSPLYVRMMHFIVECL